ncbi:hypothetical protein ACVW2L_002257 [Mucilaginibacter sp. HD30]
MKINPWLLNFCLVVVLVATIFHISQQKYAMAMLTVLPVIPALINKKFRDKLSIR